MISDEACFAALGASRKRCKRRRQLREALAHAHERRRLEIENGWRGLAYGCVWQALALIGLAVAIGRPSWALHIATAYGALAALATSLAVHDARVRSETWQAHVERFERTLYADPHPARLIHRVNERLLWLLTAGWTAGFVVSVLTLGGDRLAIGQAACELVAFAVACAWLLEPIGPKARTG